MPYRKAAHRKVRTGCYQCKQRHVKCDETKPVCQKCVRYSLDCRYSSHVGAVGSSTVNVVCSSFSFSDFSILQHWKTSTAQSLAPNEDLQLAMREVIPLLALDHEYLMHALLALSSLHIAYLRPTEARNYQKRAAHHQSLALPSFRSALASVTKDTCHALYACGHIITKYAFASLEFPESHIFSPSFESEAEFIPVLRGAFAIRQYAKDWLRSGPLGFCLEEPLEESPAFSRNPEDAHFSQLVPLLLTDSNEDTCVCCEALNLLRTLLAMAATPNQSISVKTLTYFWPAKVPERYITLLSEGNEKALLVLAHYCVMLKMIDSFWYMRGCAARVLDHCRRYLSTEWLPHIEWPLSVVA